MTILLTSHYMKDVAALCRRVVIIAAGRIIYDGSLSGIIDRFGGHKIISLACSTATCRPDLGRYGEVACRRAAARPSCASTGPWCPRCWPAILADHVVEDVSVEDPPLEEVIAEMFSQAAERARSESRMT